MKKAVIINASGNELANQLWNYASIYAYALERNRELSNPAFFEYGQYFTMPAAPNTFFKWAFFLPFRNYTGRKTALRRRVWRKLYGWYAARVVRGAQNAVASVDVKNPRSYYLPPSQPVEEIIATLEKTADTIYFYGWLFRNPVGLAKYRNEIREYFKPRGDIEKLIMSELRTLREKYNHSVGVHIRQGDYKTWRGGKYFIEQKRVREILDEYLRESGKNPETTCFLITSDGAVDSDMFKGLHTFISRGNAVHDLFLLAKTDVIIGSNSTFGAFASYYGNIPLIVMQNETMDWDYYKDKSGYFENTYASFVFY